MKLDREFLGYYYLLAFVLAVIALLSGAWLFGLASAGMFFWTYISDEDDDNHVDPPGTTYMDREGRPVGGPEKEAV